MNIAFGCDHAGFKHRKTVLEFLRKLGHTVVDKGWVSELSSDYPDYAAVVAEGISNGTYERGVLICGTGIGMSIAANKFPGVRAAVCWSETVAVLIAQHNDANIICLPGRLATTEELIRYIDIWISTPVSTEERHRNRISKIKDIESMIHNSSR